MLIADNSIKKRRTYGEHLTPVEVFREFILPEIKDKIYDYIWVDLFAGEGNLILPILELVPERDRITFFERHIFLFDIQRELIDKAIKNAENYGIPKEVAEKNIVQRDTIKNYPRFLLNLRLPVYHITNPPYLYIGYIVKHKETQKYLEYFRGKNAGFQDLYQLGLINDLRHEIQKMIYIIPSNFLFGFSVSNKIRDEFLKFYLIKKAIILEREIFEHTGTNVVICFFERKEIPKNEVISFEGTKINKEVQKRKYILNPRNHYRAGNEFEEFINNYRSTKPLRIKYYLTIDDVEKNKGDYEIEVIDANAFNGKEYKKLKIYVNKNLYKEIKSNILFVRTVDTGRMSGRAGLYKIRDVFGVDGILVSKAKYRTHPIQVFIEPLLANEEQTLLMNYFNIVLEHFRERTDSEFMTTYKYSNSEYTRKYLGLTQVKKLIQTFPLLNSNDEYLYLKTLIKNRNTAELISFIKKKNRQVGLEVW
ncbi:MAG: N-6 DNA methylase [Thermoplasmata archaeon]|nr:N-6 DNA methylase [Thermoplasmata archaeon]